MYSAHIHLMKLRVKIIIIKILSRNEFFGGKMVRGKCAFGGVWGLPPRKVLVCLYPSTFICQFLLAGKSFLNAIILNCNWEIILGGEAGVFGGEAGVFGGEASPAHPSRLNPDNNNKCVPSMKCYTYVYA